MDSFTCTHQCWPTSKNLRSSALCRHWMPFRGLTEAMGEKDGWRKSQGYPCSRQYALIMMILYLKIDLRVTSCPCRRSWENMNPLSFLMYTYMHTFWFGGFTTFQSFLSYLMLKSVFSRQLKCY